MTALLTQPPAGAPSLDVLSDPRICTVMELMDALGRAADPLDALDGLVGGIRGAFGPCAFAQITTRDLSGRYAFRQLRTDGGTSLLPVIGSAEDGSPAAHRGGFIDQLIRTPLPKVLHDVNLARDPVLPREMAPYRSAIAVPIFAEQTARDWAVLLNRNPQAFGAAELEELIVRATLVGTVLNNLLISRQLFDANMRIQADISSIAAIQRSLLPEDLPQIPKLRLAASYETVGQAGGDLYDFVPLARRPGHTAVDADGRWAIVIGDVSGHGPAAAVVMAMLHSIIHAFPHQPTGPAQVLEYANRHLCSKRLRAFATAFLGFFDPARRTLTYARAGHHPPLLASANDRGQTMELDAVGDLPLGIDPTLEFTEASLQLEAGQALVLYTDGIPEARDSRGQLLGIEQLRSAVLRSAPEASAIIRSIREMVLAHTGGTRLSDDQTIVAAQVY